MEMLGKIRRMYFRDKLSLHQVAKRTGLSKKHHPKMGQSARGYSASVPTVRNLQ